MDQIDITQLPEEAKQQLATQASNKVDEALKHGELRNAEVFCLFALQLLPTNIDFSLKLANIYLRTARFVQARQIYLQILQQDPNNFSANASLLQLSLKLKKYYQAKRCIDRLHASNPKAFYLILWCFEWAQYTCNWPLQETLAKTLNTHSIECLNKETALLEQPLSLICRTMDQKMIFAIEKKVAQQFKKEVMTPDFTPFTYTHQHEKIHIGYVTDDFYDHPVAHLINQLFQHHDKSKFKVFLYSHRNDDNNRYLQAIKPHCDKFSLITNLPQMQAAKMIHDDEIDILVDLKGHTAFSRLGIFALKPAPIQMTFLGFPGGTGADYMDYIIADNIVIPKEDYQYYTEKVLALPRCYQPNGKDRVVANTQYTRKKLGLPEKKIILGCFNTVYKIEKNYIDCVIQILKGTDNTVFWICPENRYAKYNISKYMQAQGIDKSRVVFAKKLKKPEHLARIKLVDLMLDTFTCNGHTSTSDALWVGVPVITCQGQHFASRVSSSILTTLGIPELITYSQTEFIEKVIHLCQNTKSITALKKQTLKQRDQSALFDMSSYCQVLEDALYDVYLNHYKKA